MEFGVFDHVDRSRSALADYYEERLQVVEAFDRAGFHAYHVAEHHATPLGMAPSPSVYLAAVAQRTKRLRFGPMIYALPLYHPLRMIEEICMLDQMSGGRLDVGFGRGASPIELELFGTEPEQARDIYDEAIAVVTKGLESPELSHRGAYFNFDKVPMALQPFQKPHPPLWYGVHANDSAARSARQGLNVISLDGVAATRGFSDSYRAAWQEAGGAGRCRSSASGGSWSSPRPTPRRSSSPSAPIRCGTRASTTCSRCSTACRTIRGRRPIREIMADTRGIAGSPATVTDVIRRQMAESGADYFVGQFSFGDMTLSETLRSVGLFADRVMPKLRATS
jgi:alkanesulfonate monooxygenase SsuD/methylene tetrahydromethanopterin reductase-like flavin-dependent oxidoreductase (luciferase family)